MALEAKRALHHENSAGSNTDGCSTHGPGPMHSQGLANVLKHPCCVREGPQLLLVVHSMHTSTQLNHPPPKPPPPTNMCAARATWSPAEAVLHVALCCATQGVCVLCMLSNNATNSCLVTAGDMVWLPTCRVATCLENVSNRKHGFCRAAMSTCCGCTTSAHICQA